MENKIGYLSDYWFWRGEYTSRNQEYVNAVLALEDAWGLFTGSDEYPQDDKHLACYLWEKFDHLINSDEPIDQCDWGGPVTRAAGMEGRAALRLLNAKFPAGGSPANADCIIKMLAAGKPIREAISCRPGKSIYGPKELWEMMGIGTVRLAKVSEDFATVDLSFDLNTETEVLVAEARRFVEWAKDYRNHLGRGESPKRVFTLSPKAYARSVAGVYPSTRAEKSYQTRSDASRAIGLWLWDYKQEYAGTAKAAILAIKKKYEPEISALGFAATEENVFRAWLRKTDACITACEVLAFT